MIDSLWSFSPPFHIAFFRWILTLSFSFQTGNPSKYLAKGSSLICTNFRALSTVCVKFGDGQIERKPTWFYSAPQSSMTDPPLEIIFSNLQAGLALSLHVNWLEKELFLFKLPENLMAYSWPPQKSVSIGTPTRGNRNPNFQPDFYLIQWFNS